MQKQNNLYMQIAEAYSALSKANRAKVGAVMVTANGVVLGGVNGSPSGWNNACEDNEGNTKPEVIHAELNCILKAAREGVSCIGATIYVTLAPCRACAAMLAQAGVKRVYYAEEYRDMQGVYSLRNNAIEVHKLKE